MMADLVMKIDAVGERRLVEILALRTEHVFVEQFLVRFHKSGGEARIHRLDHALDSGVFYDVPIHRSKVWIFWIDALADVENIALLRPQRMAAFVPCQHRIEGIAHRLPNWKRENPIHKIEAGRGDLTMLNPNVFDCQQTCQMVLGFDVDLFGCKRHVPRIAFVCKSVKLHLLLDVAAEFWYGGLDGALHLREHQNPRSR